MATKSAEQMRNKTNENIELLYKPTFGVAAKANPYELVVHNDRVFQFSQTHAKYLRVSYYMSDSYKLMSKLITLNTKTGFKAKAKKTINGAFTQIYGLFESFDIAVHAENPAYTVFYNFSRSFTDEFYKPDFFLKYVYLNLELLFLIKKIKPKKKLKKKKNQQKTMVSYLSQRSRVSITTRIINAYLNQSNERIHIDRIRDSLLYLAFSGKSSFLYKKKLAMYNKLLEKKKFY